MGQFFQVNGDYNIKSKEGSTITLDPGATGTVAVTGNLNVAGTTTTINSSNINIEDRIITVNKGETGPGVSLRFAGIEVDRGTGQDRAAFVWDETVDAWIVASGTDPYATLTNSKIQVDKIITPSNSDLTLIGAGTGVVKVAGTTSYRLQVTDPDDIPNKDYVDYSILNNPTFQIRAPQSEDTRIIIADKDVTPNLASTAGSLAYYQNETTYPQGSESKISVLIDGVLITNFYPNRVEILGMEFTNGTISNTSATNDNIFIQTNGTGKLQTNYGIQLDNNVVSPAMVTGSHVIYSKSQSTGKSGIFFVNTENNRDELVSKNRALLFSMLF